MMSKDYKKFKAYAAKGIYEVFKDELSNFGVDKTCQHWLFKPDGFRIKVVVEKEA